MIPHQKNPLRGILNTYAGFCRDCSRMIIYLGRWLPIDSCGSLTCVSAALHTSKDLAVSPPMVTHRAIPRADARDSIAFALDVSARTSGITTDGRYPLPYSWRTRVCPDVPPHSREAIIVLG